MYKIHQQNARAQRCHRDRRPIDKASSEPPWGDHLVGRPRLPKWWFARRRQADRLAGCLLAMKECSPAAMKNRVSAAIEPEEIVYDQPKEEPQDLWNILDRRLAI